MADEDQARAGDEGKERLTAIERMGFIKVGMTLAKWCHEVRMTRSGEKELVRNVAEQLGCRADDWEAIIACENEIGEKIKKFLAY